MKRRAAILSLALTLLVSSHSVIQAKKEKSSLKTKPASLRVPVWVRSGSNGFQTGLGIGDFRIFDEKKQLERTQLLAPDSPTLLLIALDAVGDIANIDRVRVTLKQEIGKLNSQYWVGLISARERIEVLQEPTADRSLLEQKIDAYSQIGKAGLLDSIQAIADLATETMQGSDVRVAVLFITDSDIGNYRQDYLNPPVNYSDSRDLSRRFAGRALQEKISRMSSTLARCHAPIFILHIEPGQDPLNREYQNGLKQLAETAGGQLFLSKTINDIPPMIQEAFNWIRNFYVLAFKSPSSNRRHLKIRIALKDDQPSSVAGNRLTYVSRLALK